MKPVAYAYAVAETRAAATALAAATEGARYVSGNQSLGPMLNLRLARPSALIDLSRAADLRRAEDEGDAVVYGAAVTHAEIEDGCVIDATPGWLARAARRIAYRAVRNRGTIGGSLAHADPAADWVNVMTALGGEVILAGTAGSREVPLAAFFVGAFTTALAPGEIIAGVRIRKRGPRARFAYWKFCRKVGEFAKASSAVLIDPARGETRILLGAIERPPVFLAAPEVLISAPGGIADAVKAAAPELSEESHALHVVAVRRAIAEAVGVELVR